MLGQWQWHVFRYIYPMKKRIVYVVLLVILVSAFAKAQSEQIARNYADQGQYEKSILAYEKALKKQEGNTVLIEGLVKSYQQLEQYDKAEEALKEQLKLTRDEGIILVELGYNDRLRGRDSLSKVYFNQVYEGISAGTINAYRVAKSFQNKSLLEEAVFAFEEATRNNPNVTYGVELAKLYGELGEVEKMFNTYLDLINQNDRNVRLAQRSFSLYITDDPLNEANGIFRKTLLKRLQSEQNVLYNELLSWLFIQEKQFLKAFAQEKAIFKRTDGSYEGLINLAAVAIEEQANDDAITILNFIKENVSNQDIQLEAERELLTIEVHGAVTTQEKETIKDRYKTILNQYGITDFTVPIQIDYAHFVAFYMGNPDEAIAFLKESLALPLGRFDEARLKMELADILVYDKKFNQALVYYSQIQNKITNNTLSQEARFKVAKTSYYKGDFDWAENQLDVLKAGATQLIANDALELLLIIRDNSVDDSLQTALKKFATADLLAFQNKKDEAIALYDDILEMHKGEKIEDEALLAQAKLLEAKGDFTKAQKNYITIIEYYKDGILADDAYYRLGRLYEGPLNEPEKAKDNYERIIFDLADSIYYVEAQKRFRTLRGDAIN